MNKQVMSESESIFWDCFRNYIDSVIEFSIDNDKVKYQTVLEKQREFFLCVTVTNVSFLDSYDFLNV